MTATVSTSALAWRVGDHSRLEFLPDRQLKLMKAQEVCLKVNLYRAALKGHMLKWHQLFFFFLIFLYSIALYPQCFNLQIKTLAIRATKLNVFGFFFHLIKNAQNRKRDVRKEEPPLPRFQPVSWGWLVVLKDVVLVLVCTFPHPSCWVFQLIFLSERCISFLVSPNWDRFGVTSADTLQFD